MNGMKTGIVVLLLLAALLLICSAGLAENEMGADVILPSDYESSGLSYPVLYLLPQDGYQADDSGLAELLTAGMEAHQGLPMIIVRPSFAEGTDPLAEMDALIGEIDGAYRTIADPEHRALIGTGVGGYLAYALALSDQVPVTAAVSIRGDFASEANPWLASLGSIAEKMEEMHRGNGNVFDSYYTYLDAPVDDAWTNLKGSTNDLGSLMIGYGTGSAFHEFTVRPGAYTEDFAKESVSRVLNRLTDRMLNGVFSGTVTLEKAALTKEDPAAQVQYVLRVSEGIGAFGTGMMEMTVGADLCDSETGEAIAGGLEYMTINGAGTYEGAFDFENDLNIASAKVRLTAYFLGSPVELDSATLVRVQEPVADGDDQRLDLMGDWYFNYTGTAETLDAAALTADTWKTWAVVQPGLASWTKGFGNISDDNVTSGYGPDYFDFFITGSGYYARSFTVPDTFTADAFELVLGYADDRCEAWLNGKRIGATGLDDAGMPTGDTTWAVFSHFPVDPQMLNVGGENTLVVRVWNDLPFGAGGWYGGPIGLYSASAFEALYGEGASPRFYEESFESYRAAEAKGLTDPVENRYLIYLPEGYEDSEDRYPTVYLLHQFNSDHTSYRTDHVDRLLDEGIKAGLFDRMIVVIPNSDENSWWKDGWEKMITEELIPLIDAKYRTVPDARYRLTAGCSMGGQGAYGVALRNPDFFSGAISFFGAFSYGGENNPVVIASRESAEYLKYFTLYFCCGNQDSYGFGAPAIALNQRLEALGVPHRFFIENGGHDSAFYVPRFQDAFAYVRANMTHTDERAAALLTGKITVTDGIAEMTVTAGEELLAYRNQIPASSYTVEETQDLRIPLTLEIEQDGAIVLSERIGTFFVNPENLTHTVRMHLNGMPEIRPRSDLVLQDGAVDRSKPYTLRLKAGVFEKTVTLAEAEIK